MGMDHGPRASFPIEAAVHGEVADRPPQGGLQRAGYGLPPPKLSERSSRAGDDDPRAVEDREVPFPPSDQPEREECTAGRAKGVHLVLPSCRRSLGSLRALSVRHDPLLTGPSGAVLP